MALDGITTADEHYLFSFVVAELLGDFKTDLPVAVNCS